jgi:acyl-coenzyme A thioesterase PaaI-like protein
VIHGGTLTALVDQAMSLIAWEAVERQPVVTVHMDTTFLSSEKPGDFLEVEARLVDRKESLVFLEAAITSDDVRILKASCVMKRVKSRPGEERDNGNSG